MNRVRADVLVIGGGGAGARAAIAAADAGAGVILIHRGKAGRTGATTHGACEIAGYNVPDGAKDATDNPDAFARDILDAGMGMADPALVALLADNAVRSLRDLEEWGLSFERENGRYLVMKGCFSTKPRGHIIKGHGEPVMNVLLRQIGRRSSIAVMEDTTAVSLLTRAGVCAGAVIMRPSGELSLAEAKAVVLATGGASRVFRRNLNPGDVTGDGYRLAHAAGAQLVNMEFMQAGIGFSHPVESLFNTYLWAGVPDVRNARGGRFLHNNLPPGLSDSDIMREHTKHFPFSSRDVSRFVEINVQREIAEGRGTERGGIPVSFAHFTPEYVDGIRDDSSIRELFPMVREHFRAQGIDILRDPVEIGCFAQAINGGVKIDATGMSTLPGLFAAGEAAGGPHGADRLGGNMFVTCQVFGRLAGEGAARHAASAAAGGLDEAEALRQSADVLELASKRIDSRELVSTLQESAQKHLLIRRSKEGLETLLNCAASLESMLRAAPGGGRLSPDVLGFLGLLSSARLMAGAALARRETRGSHFRADFPERNDADFGHPALL